MADTQLQFSLSDSLETKLAEYLGVAVRKTITNLAEIDHAPKWMDTVTAASYCGVSRTTLLEWVKRDGLQFVMVHRVKRFSRKALDEFMEAHLV